MSISPVFLWTDLLLYLLFFIALIWLWSVRRSYHWQQVGLSIISNRLAAVSLIILLLFGSIAALDSFHFKTTKSTEVMTALDYVLAPMSQDYEKSYSQPFAIYSYLKEAIEENGKLVQGYPRLHHAGVDVNTLAERNQQIIQLTLKAVVVGLGIILGFIGLTTLILTWLWSMPYKSTLQILFGEQRRVPWRVLLLTLAVAIMLLTWVFIVSPHYHILGTSKIGQDIFYQAVKSVRTGLVIGTLTTLLMLPFAVTFGISAGYFGGRIDDIIQYLYTTLSSIPGVLLIAASILSLQVFMTNNPDLFQTIEQRADARLLALCVILGVTSWTGLCRLLRAETLKIREIDYIQAARALGTGRLRILFWHILPNVMHLVLIAIVLDFSGLVLAEAVLSYVGVGVDPTSISWGNMINSARLELAREPVVWWPLLAAFLFMFVLVLAANLFADAVRDALDPRKQ
jgi:peptide/nickel transport system permease protein